MYELAKCLAAQLLMPLPICLGLLGVGILLLKRRYRRTGWSALVSGLALLTLASWGPVAERLLMPLETRYPALQSLPKPSSAEAIVVLGGGWRPSAPWSSTARLNDSSASRLMEGVRLWRQATDLPLVVTGASRHLKKRLLPKGMPIAPKPWECPTLGCMCWTSPPIPGRKHRQCAVFSGKALPWCWLPRHRTCHVRYAIFGKQG